MSVAPIERDLIAAILNGGPIEPARKHLPDDGSTFDDPFYGQIWRDAVKLHIAGRPVNAAIIGTGLNGHLKGDLGNRFLDVAAGADIIGDVEPYAAEIAREYGKRQLRGQLQAALDDLEQHPDRARARIAAYVAEAPAVAGVDQPTGWTRIDLADALRGDAQRELPTVMPRVDGNHLLYAGRVNDFHGESESAKSFIAQYVCAEALRAGLDVLYLDYETDEALVVPRLRLFGCEDDEIREHFDYRRPDSPGTKDPAYADLFTHHYAVAIIDGVTDSIGLAGGSISDNDDIARWRRELPDRVARDTGAAVVMIDHVTKDKETRGRYAIGGQAKLAGISGASYTFEVLAEVAPGLRGEVALRVAKDRPGAVRAVSGKSRPSDRTQEAARVVIDSTINGVVTVTVNCGEDIRIGDESPTWHPTNLMGKISAFLTLYPGSSARAVVDGVKGNTDGKRQALAQLVNAGYVVATKAGRGGGYQHNNVVTFAEGMDPEAVQEAE